MYKYVEKMVCVCILQPGFRVSAPTLETWISKQQRFLYILYAGWLYDTALIVFICTTHSQNVSGILYIIRNITSPKRTRSASDMDFSERSESQGKVQCVQLTFDGKPLHCIMPRFHIQKPRVIRYRTWNIQCIVYSQHLSCSVNIQTSRRTVIIIQR